MKKIIILFLIGSLFLPGIISTSMVMAQDGGGDGGDTGGDLIDLPDSDLFLVLGRLADWLWTILLITATVFIIIAAYFFVTAAGNPEQIKRGREIIQYVLIGVIVAGLALAIVSILRSIVE